jgi:hypothetical protein
MGTYFLTAQPRASRDGHKVTASVSTAGGFDTFESEAPYFLLEGGPVVEFRVLAVPRDIVVGPFSGTAIVRSSWGS